MPEEHSVGLRLQPIKYIRKLGLSPRNGVNSLILCQPFNGVKALALVPAQPQDGSTAVASISTLASSSTKAETTTMVMAGKW